MSPELYLKAIVEPLLSHPESLVIKTKKDDMGILLTMTLHRADMGPVIGKEGETAKAIRTIMRVHGSRNSARVAFKITEPDGSMRYTEKTEWAADKDLLA